MVQPSSKLPENPSMSGSQSADVSESELIDELVGRGLLEAKELDLARQYQDRMARKESNNAGSGELLENVSNLYQASQDFSQARTSEEVYRQVINHLKHLPFSSSMLSVLDNQWQVVNRDDGITKQDRILQALVSHQVTPREIDNSLILKEYLLVSQETEATGISKAIQNEFGNRDGAASAIIPMRTNHRLSALIFVTSDNRSVFTENTIQFCLCLAKLASASLQNVKSLEFLEARGNRLENLVSSNRVISSEIDINNIYRVIHEQITDLMGAVDLVIATYDPENDAIEIPYACEGNRILSIPPVQFGEGLTSILIKSRKPLLLSEDTGRISAELGGLLIGAPAKSWLGVPLLLDGEPIGAIMLQDLEQEHRFNEEDQLLLTKLSEQAAVALHNARLFHEANTKSHNAQKAAEITNKLWSITDVETIMQTTLEQLGKTLNASKGMIQLKTINTEVLDSSAEAILP